MSFTPHGRTGCTTPGEPVTAPQFLRVRNPDRRGLPLGLETGGVATAVSPAGPSSTTTRASPGAPPPPALLGAGGSRSSRGLVFEQAAERLTDEGVELGREYAVRIRELAEMHEQERPLSRRPDFSAPRPGRGARDPRYSTVAAHTSAAEAGRPVGRRRWRSGRRNSARGGVGTARVAAGGPSGTAEPRVSRLRSRLAPAGAPGGAAARGSGSGSG